MKGVYTRVTLPPARVWGDSYIDTARPPVSVYRNARVLPTRSTRPGVVLTAAGDVAPPTLLARGASECLIFQCKDTRAGAHGQATEPAPEIHLPEAIYCGRLFGHFGHFLLETASRAVGLEQLPGGIPVIFHATEPIGNITGKSAQQALLPALGIVPDRLLSADMIIAVGHLLVPWPYMEIRRKLHVLFLEYMKAAADSIVGQSSSPSQKIYLSRRKLERGLRSITNELEIEEIFVQAGFAVVFPEEMSFVEQVGLFRAAGTVAGSLAQRSTI